PEHAGVNTVMISNIPGAKLTVTGFKYNSRCLRSAVNLSPGTPAYTKERKRFFQQKDTYCSVYNKSGIIITLAEQIRAVRSREKHCFIIKLKTAEVRAGYNQGGGSLVRGVFVDAVQYEQMPPESKGLNATTGPQQLKKQELRADAQTATPGSR
ncbi:MAG TPA: hypothetical protein VKS21_09430, partial [Spirochaetota bacterium]|nr:hypothetical protein [Spirochaetota bacterium]